MSSHLILGGCGFIGRHVALLLARGGDQVMLADRVAIDPAVFGDVAERVEWRFADIGSADFDTLVEGIDVVHHYAWGSIPASANANPAGDLMTNVGATLALLDALHRRGRGRVVFASSGGRSMAS